MKLDELVHAMLTENTGIALCDSGGTNGRMWQRNAGKTLEDFRKEDAVKWNGDYLSVSTFHYLTGYAGLSLDETCEAFNALPCEDWDGESYGLSKLGDKWLKDRDMKLGDTFNTYNGDWLGDQTLQGTYVIADGTNIPDYVLLQVHGGADVRGGYTDAKLFKVTEGYLMPPEVSGEYAGKTCDTMYDGYSLKTEDGESLPDGATPEGLELNHR